MQAAITAAQRGHRVTLVEKTARLGGILNFAGDDPTKCDLTRLARAMEAELRALKVDVRLNTPFSPALLAQEAPEAVIAAVGSAVTDKGVPGMDSPHVLSAMDAYRKNVDFGRRAVVIGGGQTGCETAEHIARTGCRVTLVAKHGRLCPDAYRLHGIKLRALLEELGCEVLYGCVCSEVTKTGVIVRTVSGDKERFVEADCIVNALGMEPVSCEAIEKACAGLAYYAVGDCVRARNVCDALEEGYLAAVRL